MKMRPLQNDRTEAEQVGVRLLLRQLAQPFKGGSWARQWAQTSTKGLRADEGEVENARSGKDAQLFVLRANSPECTIDRFGLPNPLEIRASDLRQGLNKARHPSRMRYASAGKTRQSREHETLLSSHNKGSSFSSEEDYHRAGESRNFA
jgi:hypothetical protein